MDELRPDGRTQDGMGGRWTASRSRSPGTRSGGRQQVRAQGNVGGGRAQSIAAFEERLGATSTRSGTGCRREGSCRRRLRRWRSPSREAAPGRSGCRRRRPRRAETAPARDQRYRTCCWRRCRRLPARTGSPGEMAVADPTRRGTGGAGLPQVLAAAIGERDLTGARDVASVIDARLRHRTGALSRARRPVGRAAPRDRRPRAPRVRRADRRAMDARKERIGEHAADTRSRGQ